MKSFFESFLFNIILLGLMAIGMTLGLVYGLFFDFWWYDVWLHALGGFWIVFLSISLLKYFNIDLAALGGEMVFFLFLIGMVAVVGILWEFFEFALDRWILKTNFTFLSRAYEDLIHDLFWDLSGGITGFVLYYYSYIRKKS